MLRASGAREITMSRFIVAYVWDQKVRRIPCDTVALAKTMFSAAKDSVSWVLIRDRQTKMSVSYRAK